METKIFLNKHLLLYILIGFFIFDFSKVDAASVTAVIGSDYSYAGAPANVTMSAWTNKDIYAPGETIIITGFNSISNQENWNESGDTITAVSMPGTTPVNVDQGIGFMPTNVYPLTSYGTSNNIPYGQYGCYVTGHEGDPLWQVLRSMPTNCPVVFKAPLTPGIYSIGIYACSTNDYWGLGVFCYNAQSFILGGSPSLAVNYPSASMQITVQSPTPPPPTVNIWFSLFQKVKNSLASFIELKNPTGIDSAFAESK